MIPRADPDDRSRARVDGQVDQDSVDVVALADYEALGLTQEQVREQLDAARERATRALGKTTGEGRPQGAASPGKP